MEHTRDTRAESSTTIIRSTSRLTRVRMSPDRCFMFVACRGRIRYGLTNDLLYVATNNRRVIGIEKGSTTVIDLMAETLEGRLIAARDFRIHTAECYDERNP